MKIEEVQAATLIPYKAFNSFISRRDVRKHVKRVPESRKKKLKWKDDMEIGKLIDLLCPEKKERKHPKK